MMRVLVLWADASSANLGVRVLAEGARSAAQDAWGSGIQVDHQDFQSWTLGEQLHRRSVLLDRLGLKRTWSDRLRTYDVILDTGAGDSFTDIYGLERTAVMTQVQRVALKAGIPYVFLPQTIGPFRSRLGRRLALPSLRQATSVMTRDSASAGYCRSLGKTPDVEATDLVFALPQPHVCTDAVGELDVLLNVSGLLWSGNSHVDPSEYRSLVRGVAARLLDQGRRIDLLPHVLENDSADNDIPVAYELAAEFGVEVVRPSDLDHARTLVAAAKLVIGSRMHACLNALSVGTPSIPLAYSRKFAPLMGDLGWKHVLDLRDRPAADDVVNLACTSTLRDDLRHVRASADEARSSVVAALRHIA